jgi:hypothetical protein
VGKVGETHGVFPGLSIGDRAGAVRRGSAQPTVHKFTALSRHGVRRPVPTQPSIGRGKPRRVFASRAPDADAADYTSRAFLNCRTYGYAASSVWWRQRWMAGSRLRSLMNSMMRCFSSCFELTRMWRGTERAALAKKPSTRLSQEPCFLTSNDRLAMHDDKGLQTYREETFAGAYGNDGVTPIPDLPALALETGQQEARFRRI